MRADRERREGLPGAPPRHVLRTSDRARLPALGRGRSRARLRHALTGQSGPRLSRGRCRARYYLRSAHRSEEHTSELQSLMRISYAVFCLKKKTNSDLRPHVSNEDKTT